MTRKAPEVVNILKIKLDDTHKDRVIRQVHSFITREHKKRNSPFIITTPNPEIILKASSDNGLKNIINNSDISVPDGVGLNLVASYVLGNNKGLNIIKGRKLFLEMIRLANKRGWTSLLVGNERGSADKAVQELSKNYKNIKLHSSNGPKLNNEGVPVSKKDRNLEKEVIDKINNIKPDFLFVAFGAPKQEKWIWRIKDQAEFKVGMVVGKTFEFISGESKVPPAVVEKIRLEWLWRLMTGSQELTRVFNAVIVFPLKVFQHRLKS